MTATVLEAPGLATTDDPQVLVPGSLHALYGDADDLTRQAGELTELADAVRRRTVETWFGEGAERWAELRPALADGAAATARAYEVGAAVIRAQAGALIRARAIALVAVRLWRQALAEEGVAARAGRACVDVQPRLGVRSGLTTVPAVRSVGTEPATGAGEDPTGLRALAELVLARARDGVVQHTAQVAAVLDQLSDGLPDGEFHLADVGVGLWDWLQGLSRLWWATHPAHWALQHDAALADAERIIDGLELTVSTLVDRPHEANRLLLDSQLWHDAPGRWLGQAAPDAAMTAVAGAGLLTRGASRLTATLRTLENLGDVARPAPAAVPGTTPVAVAPRWTSTDPLVGEVATMLDEEIPGIVKGVNEWVPTLYGHQREIDINLGEIVIEVKSGRARDLAGQLQAIADTTGRRPIAYAPEMPTAARFTVLAKGFAVAHDKEQLLSIMREFL